MSESRSPVQLLEQRRAAFALNWLNRALEKNDVDNGELKARTRHFSGMVRINGFGQTLAFYLAKSEKSAAYRQVYELVQGWLCTEFEASPYYGTDDSTHPLMNAITGGDMHAYRAAEAETRALMAWARKFAEALIGGKEQDNDQ